MVVALMLLGAALEFTRAPTGDVPAPAVGEPMPGEYWIYTAQELLDRGMVDLGPLFDSTEPVEAHMRVDMVAVRLPNGTPIEGLGRTGGWHLGGCCGTANLARERGGKFYHVNLMGREEWGEVTRDDRIRKEGTSIQAGIAVDVCIGEMLMITPGRSCGHEVAVDGRGHLFIGDSVTAQEPVDMFTRERLDTSHAENLGFIGMPGDRDVDRANWCDEPDPCYVFYRGEALRSPIAGEVSCSDGVIGIAGDRLVLRVQRSGTLGMDPNCPEDLPAAINAGEHILGSGTVSLMTARIWAETSAGAQVAVVISPEGVLYVGDIAPKLDCPCHAYN